MKKYLSMVLVFVMLALLFTACSSQQTAKQADNKPVKTESSSADEKKTDAGKNDAEKQLHFVYVSPLLAHPVWLIAKDGFEAACKELGIKGDWVGPQNISPEEMTKLVETAVAQKADAIITQGLVPETPLKMAEEANIPVLVVDSDIPGAKKLAYFGKDPEIQAKLFLEAAEKKLGKDTKLEVSIMVAALNYKIAQDQIAAIEKVFAQHPGGFEIVNKAESKSDKMKAVAEWQNTFKAYPEINVAINLAAEAGPACAKVVQEMDLEGKVTVFAVDDVQETLDLVKKGDIEGTVVTSFYNYGYQAVYWLYQHITEGKKPEKVNNDAGTIMVAKENLDTYAPSLRVKTDLK
jgi:ribose transport system substrate-binding protein